MKLRLVANERERVYSMLPDNFDFAQLPMNSELTLKEIGMLVSDIENIDYSLMSWLKHDLDLKASTNEGFVNVPVLWQTPERSFQIKNEKELRDDAGALKLPIISVERTNITKDPERKGSYQAHLYSPDRDGRVGRMILAKKIKQDKTRNFAVVKAVRNDTTGENALYSPRTNKKIVIQTLSIPIPVYVNVEYKIVIKCEYQQQMNEMMAPFITRTGQINAFSMKRNGHSYEAFIDQSFTHNNNVSNLDEEMRMFSSEVNIRVLGYLMGEGENDDRPIVRVDENIVEVTFPREHTALPGAEDFFGG